jgi:hypothetical protein
VQAANVIDGWIRVVYTARARDENITLTNEQRRSASGSLEKLVVRERDE